MLTCYGSRPKQLDGLLNLRADDIDLDVLLGSAHPIEQNIIRYIDNEHRSHRPTTVLEVYQNIDQTFIIERMEDYSQDLQQACRSLAEKTQWTGPITAHLFIAQASSQSFPFHQDLESVLIYCVSGCKTLEVKNHHGRVILYALSPGQALYIPEGVEHRAVNHQAAMTLSFGFEHFLQDIIRRRNQ